MQLGRLGQLCFRFQQCADFCPTYCQLPVGALRQSYSIRCEPQQTHLSTNPDEQESVSALARSVFQVTFVKREHVQPRLV